LYVAVGKMWKYGIPEWNSAMHSRLYRGA